MHGLQGSIKLENNKKNHKHSWFSTSATLVNLKLSGMKYIHLTYLNHPANRTLKLYFFFPFSTQKTLLDAKINYFSISNTELQKKKKADIVAQILPLGTGNSRDVKGLGLNLYLIYSCSPL